MNHHWVQSCLLWCNHYATKMFRYSWGVPDKSQHQFLFGRLIACHWKPRGVFPTSSINRNSGFSHLVYHGGKSLENHMMTSSNGNIFRVTGPLCGEFTDPGEFPTQRPVTRSFDVFFDLRLNKRWFETSSWSLWRHCNEWHGGQLRTLTCNNKTYPYVHDEVMAYVFTSPTLCERISPSHGLECWFVGYLTPHV